MQRLRIPMMRSVDVCATVKPLVAQASIHYVHCPPHLPAEPIPPCHYAFRPSCTLHSAFARASLLIFTFLSSASTLSSQDTPPLSQIEEQEKVCSFLKKSVSRLGGSRVSLPGSWVVISQRRKRVSSPGTRKVRYDTAWPEAWIVEQPSEEKPGFELDPDGRLLTSADKPPRS